MVKQIAGAPGEQCISPGADGEQADGKEECPHHVAAGEGVLQPQEDRAAQTDAETCQNRIQKKAPNAFHDSFLSHALLGFLAAGGLLDVVQDNAHEFVLAGALLGREGDHGDIVRQLQGLTNPGHVGFPLTLLDLVVLVGHHHEGLTTGLEPLAHAAVVGGRLVADVHQQQAQGQQAGVGKPFFDEFAPPGSLLLGDLGVAVAGQVDEVDLLVDAEVIDVGGLAGGGTHPGKVFPVQEPVDDRGLAHVGPACKGDLGKDIPGAVRKFRRRADKLCVLCIQFHGSLSCSRHEAPAEGLHG